MMFKSEPALITGTITAFLTAAIGALAAFGLDISDGERNAIIACVSPTVAIILLMSAVIRQTVWSPESVEKKVDEAAITALRGETPSPVVP